MRVNNLDILHHKIIVGKSQGGDVSEYESQLKNDLTHGLKHKDPVVLDFINRLNAQKPYVLRQSFIQKHRHKIIKFCEPVYNALKWFMVASVITSLIVEFFYG